MRFDLSGMRLRRFRYLVRAGVFWLALVQAIGASAQPALLQQLGNMSPAEREALMRQYGISPDRKSVV